MRINSMPYRVLSHTADTGIEATGASLGSLIEELATGMFSLVATIEPSAAERWTKVSVESPTPGDLVVDSLSELIYLSETEDLVFCAFRVELSPGALAVTLESGGIPVAAVVPTGPPIKAVTYHRLVVEEREEGWYGRVYFDV
jgi:SHS2 domain-containing protein